MAFNFLGTLSSPQLQELRNFLEAQINDIDDEINYLYVEMDNLKQTLMRFSEADSYFGGDALNSLYTTNLPDVIKVPKQDDSLSAEIMAKVKKPFISTIKYKLERNEYKMKKLLDAIEQAKESIDRKSIAKSQTTALINEIESLFTNQHSTVLFKTTEDLNNYMQGIINVV
ncbi:MAG: hypothetical protein PHF86_04050 [Candidatus Nanoarchaeia archaeon]|jgi:dGTP triphosphohydrolase|nr:hypothetical protein [Candidatus Nanoarchaeia archaeon]